MKTFLRFLLFSAVLQQARLADYAIPNAVEKLSLNYQAMGVRVFNVPSLDQQQVRGGCTGMATYPRTHVYSHQVSCPLCTPTATGSTLQIDGIGKVSLYVVGTGSGLKEVNMLPVAQGNNMPTITALFQDNAYFAAASQYNCQTSFGQVHDIAWSFPGVFATFDEQWATSPPQGDTPFSLSIVSTNPFAANATLQASCLNASTLTLKNNRGGCVQVCMGMYANVCVLFSGHRTPECTGNLSSFQASRGAWKPQRRHLDGMQRGMVAQTGQPETSATLYTQELDAATARWYAVGVMLVCWLGFHFNVSTQARDCDNQSNLMGL